MPVELVGGAAKRELPKRERINIGGGSASTDWENADYSELASRISLGTRSSHSAQQARDADDKGWAEFEAHCGEITAAHIPWPNKEPHVYADVSKEYFKSLALRWHPDKFEAKYGGRLSTEEHSDIMQSVKEAFQLINEARR